jgi:hypothetical protein
VERRSSAYAPNRHAKSLAASRGWSITLAPVRPPHVLDRRRKQQEAGALTSHKSMAAAEEDDADSVAVVWRSCRTGWPAGGELFRHEEDQLVQIGSASPHDRTELLLSSPAPMTDAEYQVIRDNCRYSSWREFRELSAMYPVRVVHAPATSPV